MAGGSSIWSRLYNGQTSFDFIGNRKKWYALSSALVLLSVAGLVFVRLNLGIDFTGGARFQLEAEDVSVERGRAVLDRLDLPGEPVVQELGGNRLRIQTEDLQQEKVTEVVNALAAEFGVEPSDVSPATVGPKWGEQISQKAVRALIAFLVLVAGYISIRFEWKMALATLAAMFHDLIVTAGIYAFVGFEVTPSTVIALLTILGYSMYDTIVVFDRVREDTSGITGSGRMTYSQAANMALNETVMRSLNTSLTSLLPTGALLFVGAGLLGAGTLKDLALALFIGLFASAYSSVFVATPLLVDLKEREPQMQALTRRVQARTPATSTPARQPAAVTVRRLEDSPADAHEPAAEPAPAPQRATGAPPRPPRPPRQRRKGNRPGRPSGKKRR